MSTKPETIKVAVVEDQNGVREMLCVLINNTNGMTCVGTFRSAEQAIEKMPDLKPDVVLMDINLPRKSGVDCVLELKPKLKSTQFIMLTVQIDTDYVFQALKNGATGYLTKQTQASEILDAIKAVHEGGAPMSSEIARKVVQSFHQPSLGEYNLTQRERQLLDYVANGYQYKEISTILDISMHTVHSHVRNIYEKLQVTTRRELIDVIRNG